MISIKILVINGPNLNLLGIRDKNHYGQLTLKEMNTEIEKKYPKVNFDFFQSNHEGDIIDKLQSFEKYDGIIINPGALTHYSYAIRDCIEAISTKVIEVHLSNVYNREVFRQKSVISPVCAGKISGLGVYSYILGIKYLIENV